MQGGANQGYRDECDSLLRVLSQARSEIAKVATRNVTTFTKSIALGSLTQESPLHATK